MKQYKRLIAAMLRFHPLAEEETITSSIALYKEASVVTTRSININAFKIQFKIQLKRAIANRHNPKRDIVEIQGSLPDIIP